MSCYNTIYGRTMIVISNVKLWRHHQSDIAQPFILFTLRKPTIYFIGRPPLWSKQQAYVICALRAKTEDPTYFRKAKIVHLLNKREQNSNYRIKMIGKPPSCPTNGVYGAAGHNSKLIIRYRNGQWTLGYLYAFNNGTEVLEGESP